MMEGWIAHSRHDWKVLSLPANHWKWRMRHSAIDFARQVNKLDAGFEKFDAIFCTDMLGVAEFKGLLDSKIDSPIVLYFHENQIAYPNRFDNERDLHFAFTNLTSFLAANAVWFNSAFNRDSMHKGLINNSKYWRDFKPLGEINQIKDKGVIQFPGVELSWLEENSDQNLGPKKEDEPIHLLWAARWEHDKRPDELLELLRLLQNSGVDFHLSVIGESFREVPAALKQIRSEFESQIIRWGFQESRSEYWQAICDADVMISTAEHEFFGLSVVEAICAGLIPVLPNRLSYPELIAVTGEDPKSILYDSLDEAAAIILDAIRHGKRRNSTSELSRQFRKQFAWDTRAQQMDDSIETVARIQMP